MEVMTEEIVRRMADCVVSGGGERYSIQNCAETKLFMDNLLRQEGVVGLSIKKDCGYCLQSLDDENIHSRRKCQATTRMDDSAWVKIQLQRLDSARCVLDSLREKSRRNVERRDLRQQLEKVELTKFAATVERDFMDSSRSSRMALQACVERVKSQFFESGGSEEEWQTMIREAVTAKDDSLPPPMESSGDWDLPPMPDAIRERRDRGIQLNIDGLNRFPLLAPVSQNDAGDSSDTASFVSTVADLSDQWDYSAAPFRSSSHQRRDRRHSQSRRRHSPSPRRHSPSHRENRHSQENRRNNVDARRRDSSGGNRRRQHQWRRSSSQGRRREERLRRRASTGSDSSRNRRPSPSRRRSVERAVVPEVAAVEQGNDVFVYPGLDEPEPEVTLTHMRGGPFCGGWAKDTVVRNLTRLTEKVDFSEKKKGESDPVCYLRHEAEWLSIAKSAINKDTQIYTIVACFANKMTEYRASLQPLLDKQGHFTSFLHFLREWRLVRWPHIRQAVMLEAERCHQKSDESIEKYFERFRTLTEIVGWNVNDRIDWFISGLRDGKVKDSVNQHHFTTRTLEAVKQFAVDLTGRLEVAAAMEERRGRDKASKTASVAAVAAWPSTSTLPSSSGSKKSRRASKTTTAPSVSAATASATFPEEKREEAAAEMRIYKIGGCYGCLQRHKFDNFETYLPFCPFCEYTFKKGAARHFPMACSGRPATRNEMIDAIKRAKERETASTSGAAK